MLFRVACAWIRNCIGRRVGVPGVGVGVGGGGVGVAFDVFATFYLLAWYFGSTGYIL